MVADISERNSDTGAQATATLMLGPTPVAESKTVSVPADGSFSVTFEGVKLTTATSAELKVVIDGAEPFETDATNNTGTTTVEVTEHELVRSNILVQSLGGYGAQFNNHVYAPITPWPAGTPYDDFEAKAKALQPHIVRVFYQRQLGRKPERRVSRLGEELRLVREGRPPRAGGRSDDQHQLPEPRERAAPRRCRT